jgi:subtilisin
MPLFSNETFINMYVLHVSMNMRNMLICTFISLFIVIILTNSAIATRYIASSKAANIPCTLIQKGNYVNVYECQELIASQYKLSQDIPVKTIDIGANTQLKATIVQNKGVLGTGRKVVVLDTGYNYNHPDLMSSYLGGKDFVNNDQDPIDDNGHGSHVAGLITSDGISTQAKGIAPKTGIIVAKVLNAQGKGSTSNIIEAIYWAVNGPDGIYGTADDFKADAISISIGSDPPFTYSDYCDNLIPELTTAIQYAVNKGVPVVIGAGNYGSSGVSVPGCISYAYTVGAVDQYNNWTYFSGQGKAVDFVTPGTALYSTWYDNSYQYRTGTSMATPLLAGTIALMKQINPYQKPSITYATLKASAIDYGIRGWDNKYGWGMIDVSKAVYPQVRINAMD